MSSDPTSTAVSSLWSPLPSLPTIIILTISPTPNSEYCSHTICHILSPCLPIDTSIYILYKQPNPRQNGLNTLLPHHPGPLLLQYNLPQLLIQSSPQKPSHWSHVQNTSPEAPIAQQITNKRLPKPPSIPQNTPTRPAITPALTDQQYAPTSALPSLLWRISLALPG